MIAGHIDAYLEALEVAQKSRSAFRGADRRLEEVRRAGTKVHQHEAAAALSSRASEYCNARVGLDQAMEDVGRTWPARHCERCQ